MLPKRQKPINEFQDSYLELLQNREKEYFAPVLGFFFSVDNKRFTIFPRNLQTRQLVYNYSASGAKYECGSKWARALTSDDKGCYVT